ncbi:Rib/alpha-like domain-containing protein [Streptococcus mitis]|uniref:Rib/alpha-like domain-containing protein n=1 Tax=Streptococcus mitis TaxID=28037 RepID=UPI001D179D5C|nr:Rib/alpha-like domain-containing protein [Streptococcus mitis]
MYSRMEKNHGQKVQRFSIRKYSFGAASVAVAAYMMFGGAATVQADAQVTPKTASDSQTVPDASNQADSTMPLASTETATPTAEQPSTPAPAATQPTAPTETPKAEEALAPASKADTSKLEAAIARMEAALEKAGLTEKTASAIEAAKAELAKAQSLLSNDKATQTEVDYSTSSLKNRAFVLESMPKATADKKENKNQDSRNGQAIPGQGESGFRAVDTTAANSAEEATKYKGARDAALPELEANIAKIKAELAAEEGKAANKQDLAKIDTYKKVIEKAEGIATAAKAADATSAKEMSKQAEAVKSERDLLKLYLDEKADLGAPVSENHAGYGNNPSNGVFESLKEGFGDKVTFSDADKKSFTVAKQYESGRDLTNKIKNLPDAKDPIGSATYNWQEKAITKADAEAGMLNGWKIENGEKVNAVKPLDVTNVTDKDGNTSDREVWKSKVYTNDGELIKYQTSGEVSYVNGSGLVPLAMPTITGRASEDSSKRVLGMQNNTFGEVKNRDYYLELGSQGTTLSKEYDVNANSRLTVSLIHSGAYGGSTATDAGERVKLKIVDAFTGAEIKPVDGKDGALTTEQGPYSGTGWTHLDRLYDIPEGTTKVKVLIEAGEQGTNSLINNNNIKLKDGYIIGGIGIATAPAAEVVTNVRSENKKGEYGYTKDTIYEKGQKGVFDIDIKNTGGMNIDYYTAQKVEVTVKVPKGVTLEDKIYNANGGSAYLGHTFANDIVWTPNDPADNTQGGTITYKVPAGNRMPAAEAGSRKTEIPFTTADNFIGPADFKVTVKSGFGDTDALGNRLYSYTALGTDPAYSNQFNRNGLADSDNPDYVYGKVIFINSLKGSTVVTVPINTTNGQLKEVAIAKAKEEIALANFIQLLEKMKATAALGDTTGSLSNVQISSKDKVEITKIAEDGRGIVKVPVTYTADGKTYETTVDVEVNVVKSTTKPVVVFEGDEIAPATVKENVTPAEIDKKAGQANEPQATDIFDTNGKVGQTDLKVPTTVTYNVDGTTITENVEVPVTVLPRPKADEILVAKNSDKEEAKAKILEKAKAALGESYTNKLPAGVTFDKDNMTVGEIPELTEDGEVPVTVKYTVNGEEKTTVIKVPVTVVEGTPQIVPVDPKTAPKAEDSIDPADYPEGAKFTYEKEPDTSSTGDKEVKVIVTDKDGNELVRVPATVRVVGAYRQYVPVDTKPETVLAKDNIDPEEFPEGTTFEYKDKDNKPVDTKTTGDKDVVVVAKLNGEPIAEIPAKVTVVGPKTQYVVANPDNTQPTPADSLVDKDKYGFPDKATFEYKEKVDTTKPGGKDVTVVVKDADGDTIVEVPAKVKVVQGNPQIIPVDQGQPLAENSINKGDYPEGATFEYEKVDGKDPVNISEAGDNPVTVVVKDKDGNVLVKVPTTVRVVGAYRQYVPVNTDPTKVVPAENIVPTDFPEGTTFEYKTPVDTSKPGDKDVVVVAKLKNGETIAEIPAKVTVVEPKTQYVAVGNEPDVNKSVDPSVFPKEAEAKPEYKEKDISKTPGEKDVTVVVKDKDGDTIVEVPAKVKVVQGNPQIIPVDQGQPLAENSINKGDYPEGATFEYEKVDGKDPVNISEAGDYPVNVIVKDKDGNKLVTVPTTVRVVDAYRQYVPVDTDPKKVIPAENIVPTDFPDGTTFEYKTPVDTTTPGDKDVVVVAKLNGEPIAEIPAKVTVVGPKTQYVAANPENTQPDVNKSVDPSVFPKEAKAKVGYKEDVDTKTPGIKDVTVVVKDEDGDSIVEVPAKVIVVQGKEQEVTVNPDKAPEAKDNINPKDFPEGATFTFKEQPDTKTPGKKNVIVVVKDKDGNLLVEVPAVVNVVERKEEPQTPKETVTATPIVVEVGMPITKEDVKGHVKLPKDAEIIEVGEIPTTETPGVKASVKVKVKLPTGEIVVVDVPVTVIPKRIPETNPYNGDGYNGGGNGGNNYRPTPTPQNVPSRPTAPEQPVTPTEPGQSATPNQTQPAAPAQADATVATDTAAKPATPKYVDGQKELPNTGTEANASLAALGLLGALGGFGLLSRKKKED